MVAHALDDRGRARVADGEPFADETAEERHARGRAVEDRVARDDVLLGDEGGALGRPQREHAAGKALADVVVRLADQRQLDAGREPRPERLAGRAAQREPDRSRRQAERAVRARHRMGEKPAHRAVAVRDRELGLGAHASVDCLPRGLDQTMVERVAE